jgi:hypothetical protein
VSLKQCGDSFRAYRHQETAMNGQTEIREMTATELEAVAGGVIGQAAENQQLTEVGNDQTAAASQSLFAHCATGKHIQQGKITCR